MKTSSMKSIRLALTAFGLSLLSTVADQPVISLAREWKFELDPKDAGTGEAWFRKDLGGAIQLNRGRGRGILSLRHGR